MNIGNIIIINSVIINKKNHTLQIKIINYISPYSIFLMLLTANYFNILSKDNIYGF